MNWEGNGDGIPVEGNYNLSAATSKFSLFPEIILLSTRLTIRTGGTAGKNLCSECPIVQI